MTEANVTGGNFYWVWIDTSTRHSKEPLVLVVAQSWRDPQGRLYWEGCGTDEGVRVIKIVAEIEPPSSERP